MSFVLTESVKNVWHAIGGSDTHIVFRPNCEPETGNAPVKGVPRGKIGEQVQHIINAENSSSWTLMHRYNRCRELLCSGIDHSNRENIAFFYVWLRYSFMK
jgi:hypothetical protein